MQDRPYNSNQADIKEKPQLKENSGLDPALRNCLGQPVTAGCPPSCNNPVAINPGVLALKMGNAGDAVFSLLPACWRGCSSQPWLLGAASTHSCTGDTRSPLAAGNLELLLRHRTTRPSREVGMRTGVSECSEGHRAFFPWAAAHRSPKETYKSPQ